LESAKVIRTNVAELSMDKRGFLRLTLLNNDALFDLTEAKKQLEAENLLTNNQPYRLLIDTRKSVIMPDKEAEKHISLAQSRKVEAIIITSLYYRILAKYYIKHLKNTPAKVFRKEEDAIAWLLSLDVE